MGETSAIIDCDVAPFCPDGWRVEAHHKNGKIEWNPDKVQLCLTEDQLNKKITEGNKLRVQLKDKDVVNANMLDFLLVNPENIPHDWKKNNQGETRNIFFWGTIYQDHDNHLCVRFLYHHNGIWNWSAFWLNGGWGRLQEAVVHVK
jgi:hypothetical protein